MNHPLGLKLWSTNENYIKPALNLYDKGFFQYIELYSIPDSYENFSSLWKNIDIPFQIHGPHFKEGVNFALKEKEEFNKKQAEEALRFADLLKADWVIFHPGVSGDIHEAGRQLKSLADQRILIENKPYYSTDGKWICNGASFDEISTVLQETGYQFCLDFGHATCAANALKIDPFEFINKMISLDPALYHLTDGDYNSIYDRHDHFGKGSFPIQKFLQMIPDGKCITNESYKDSKENLDDFEKDIVYLKILMD